jgi:hypothetical protein
MMSYASAKRNYETQNFEVGGETTLRCSDCQQATAREDLGAYGAKCLGCFTDYCKAAPRYEIAKDYPRDPLAWAKRIMDRQRRGESVSTFASKLALEALGNKHDL